MRFFLILLTGSLAGCIISVTSHRACSAVEPCPDGSSCNAGECIDEDSLFLGEDCTAPKQCYGYPEVTCGTDPESCRVVCEELLRVSDTCRIGEYCRAERRAGHPDEWVGTCIDSECWDNSDCHPLGDGLSCVSVTSAARGCFGRCEIVDTGAAYADTCGSTETDATYCQPIGPAAHETLVCLERLTSAAFAPGPGEICDPVADPCEPGAACVVYSSSVPDALACRAYCDLSRGNTDCTDPTAPQCCGEASGAGLAYAVCRPVGC